jgi:hypothetical protein
MPDSKTVARQKVSPQIAKERIELLCHTVNKVVNEMPWFDTGPQEFTWALESALKHSGLPETWVKVALLPGMVADYQTCFKANGYCIKADDLRALERVING